MHFMWHHYAQTYDLEQYFRILSSLLKGREHVVHSHDVQWKPWRDFWTMLFSTTTYRHSGDQGSSTLVVHGNSGFVKNPDAQVISDILTWFSQSVALKVPAWFWRASKVEHQWCEARLPDVKDAQGPGHPGYLAPPSASLTPVQLCSLSIPICHHEWMFPRQRWQDVQQGGCPYNKVCNKHSGFNV